MDEFDSNRSLISSFRAQFERLHARSLELLSTIPDEELYCVPSDFESAFPALSCGVLILRSAAVVEQTFGGITANLWDDPFEWTLPETLSTRERVVEYLNEVGATRERGFSSFRSDADLQKLVMVPSGRMTLLFDLIVGTLLESSYHLGAAAATISVAQCVKARFRD